MQLKTRFGSMLLDHIFMTVIISAIAIPFYIASFFSQRLLGVDFSWIGGILGILIYLNKDYFKGKSPAKRIIGLQVVNYSDQKPATPLQCFIRNLTIPLWPIEVLFTLFSTQRRMGDLIAGTVVVPSQKEALSTLVNEIKSTLKHTTKRWK